MSEADESPRSKRDATSRAWFFLKLVRDCPYPEDIERREPFEAHLKAALVFTRVAIHRQHLAATNKA